MWYKLTDKTIWGAWFSLLGLSMTIGFNAALVPTWGYMGCAWAAFSCYALMMISSFIVGQIKYPIAYPLKRIGLYTLIAAALYCVGEYAIATHVHWINWIVRFVLLSIYVLAVIKIEKIHPKQLLRPILSKVGL